ncbi:MAG: penicillin acylase family protein, partial [Dehalococcoidia bacterium]
PIAPDGEERPLTLRWVGYEPVDIMQTLLDLNRAPDWESFRQALHNWTVPAQNFVYADVDGDIGYLFGGWVPVRAKGQGLVPVPGWTGEYEWTGYIPLDELPQAHNPTTHYLATANNRVVDDGYPYFISTEWLNGYRARRICDLLGSSDQFSIDDFKTMQMDFYWLPGKELAGFLADLSVEEDDLKQALGVVRNWNYHLTANSVAGAIPQVFLDRMMHNTFADKLGDELAEAYFGKGAEPLPASTNIYLGRSTVVLLNLMQDPESPWFDQTGTDQVETRDDIMRLSLREAVDFLREKLGADMNQWQWGKLHQVTFAHPLGVVKPLNLLFNKGPFPVGGDADTVCAMGFLSHEPYDVKSAGVSYRQIIDLGDFSRSVAVTPPGQSGQPGSKHYGDTIDDWLNGRYHPLLWERTDIEQQGEAILTLVPVFSSGGGA